MMDVSLKDNEDKEEAKSEVGEREKEEDPLNVHNLIHRDPAEESEMKRDV
jgi:hypothetical protein